MVSVSDRRKLTGLRPRTYEHPFDTKALDALEGTPGLETLVRKFNEWGLERLLRVQLTGSNLRVTASNLPALYSHLSTAIDILDVPVTPELYIMGLGEINAFTAGVENPIIVLSATAIDRLTDDELLFVIGHELGHIKSGHILYHQLAEFLPLIGGMVGGITLGVGEIFSKGLEVALVNWKRMSEFTADRAGLLACQNVDVAISTMIKLGGLPSKFYDAFASEHFITQAREFEALSTDKLNWIAKGLGLAGQTHPWVVMRANQFLAWINSGTYDQILSAQQPEALQYQFCSQCGRKLAGVEIYCQGCGVKIEVAYPQR